MEYLGIACIVVAAGLFCWLRDGGPQAVAHARRRGREADAKAEEHRIERARLELERAKLEHGKSLT